MMCDPHVSGTLERYAASVAGDLDKVQIMYGVGGERRLPETELDWLPGYPGSSPVRIGNAAAPRCSWTSTASPRRTLMGNFPQALTHVSVVQTAQLMTDGVAPGRPVGRWLGPASVVRSSDANEAAESTPVTNPVAIRHRAASMALASAASGKESVEATTMKITEVVDSNYH